MWVHVAATCTGVQGAGTRNRPSDRYLIPLFHVVLEMRSVFRMKGGPSDELFRAFAKVGQSHQGSVDSGSLDRRGVRLDFRLICCVDGQAARESLVYERSRITCAVGDGGLRCCCSHFFGGAYAS